MNNLNGSIDVDDTISGKLTAIESFSGSLSDAGQLHGSVSTQKTDYKRYDGEYDITPKAYQDQILETADKLMINNVIVHKVPYIETHNESGTTVYIAKETEYNG